RVGEHGDERVDRSVAIPDDGEAALGGRFGGGLAGANRPAQIHERGQLDRDDHPAGGGASGAELAPPEASSFQSASRSTAAARASPSSAGRKSGRPRRSA